MILYALHDFNKSTNGMFVVDVERAKEYNKKGYGIHWCPQVFKDGIRRTENLQQIRYWLADIDNGDKETMLRRIASQPIQPTFIVETKRGYHCYWRAKNATAANYATIERGIADALGADGSLITPTHTLRFPGFLHWKDPKDPFLIKMVWQKPENIYSEELMMRVFKPKPKFEHHRRFGDSKLSEMIKPENWERYLHVSEISQGGRNNGLNKIAWILKQEGADENLTLQVLLEINQTINPPLETREIQSIVRGKFR